ncbi:MAG TPA: glutathione-independent formaldehyde dehydrogenase [Candidatus Saccharimonadales bacterium]|nr:glutathione-independent formaldehyde dehydrogenase [Candidatus Saccharimonadales bacterium]
MKAVVYKGAKRMVVEEVQDPHIEQPTDAIIKVSSAAICGSDLHMYEGRTAVETGKIFGHEILGTVHAHGDAVTQLSDGDRVVLPFNIACGTCFNCVRGYTNACLTLNPDGAGAAYGYAAMGPYQGGQAEYVRVPFADFNALKLPGTPGDAHEDDFLMLADIMPTAYHANELAGVGLGRDVVIFGAGPVGLLSILSAQLRGAADIFIVDHQPSRLKKAEELGAVPITMADGNPVEQLAAMRKKSPLQASLRHGEELRLDGVLSGIDAIGWQAHDQENFEEEKHEQVLEWLSEIVLPTGQQGIIGVYVPDDPGETGPAAKGNYPIPFGTMWHKGHAIGTGQCPVKHYDWALRDCILADRVHPGTIVTNHISIEEAPEYYKRFEQREAGITKIAIRF